MHHFFFFYHIEYQVFYESSKSVFFFGKHVLFIKVGSFYLPYLTGKVIVVIDMRSSVILSGSNKHDRSCEYFERKIFAHNWCTLFSSWSMGFTLYFHWRKIVNYIFIHVAHLVRVFGSIFLSVDGSEWACSIVFIHTNSYCNFFIWMKLYRL